MDNSCRAVVQVSSWIFVENEEKEKMLVFFKKTYIIIHCLLETITMCQNRIYLIWPFIYLLIHRHRAKRKYWNLYSDFWEVSTTGHELKSVLFIPQICIFLGRRFFFFFPMNKGKQGLRKTIIISSSFSELLTLMY